MQFSDYDDSIAGNEIDFLESTSWLQGVHLQLELQWKK